MRGLLTGVLIASALAISPALSCSASKSAKPLIPAIGAAIDSAMKKTTLSLTDIESVRTMQREMKQLASSDETAARDLEERAMALLGYKKAWLRCGPGTFAWMKA